MSKMNSEIILSLTDASGESYDLTYQDVFSLACWVASSRYKDPKFKASEQVGSIYQSFLENNTQIICVMERIAELGFSFEDVFTEFIWYTEFSENRYNHADF